MASRYQQSPDTKVRQSIRQQSLQKELADWKRDLASMKGRANLADPAEFQSVLQTWAHARYPEATVGGKDAADITAVQPTNNASIQKYISDMFNAAMNNVGTISQAKTAKQPSADYVKLDPEVKVIKAVDPIILQFGNKRYTRQPNGQWTKLGQTKPIDVPMQQFLNSELAKL